MTGLAGLFASLLGAADAPSLTGEAEGVGQLLSAGVDANPILNLPVEDEIQLGDAEGVKVQGGADVIEIFRQQVQVVYQKIVVEGGLSLGQCGDAKELAGALVQLGMAPEEAGMIAQRIETMLELLKQKQEMSAEEGGSMAMMMLTAMLGQQQGMGMRVEFLSVQATTEISVRVVQNFKRSSEMGGGDVMSALLAADKQEADKMPEAPLAEVVASVGEGSENREVPVKADLLVSLTKHDDNKGDGVQVALPVQAVEQVVEKVLPKVEGPSVAAVSGKEALAMPVVVEKVQVERVIEKPKGETLYTWRADKGEGETLQAVAPVGDAGGARMDLMQSGYAARIEAREDASTQTTDALGFADRLYQARHAEVVRQVAVQIQPLAQQGGGTVRMTLNPPELGQVTIELKVNSDGTVQGAISAQDSVVVEHLARELHSLRHGLADAGLKLSEQGINLMLNNQGNNGSGNGNSQQQASGGFGGEVEGDVEVAAHWVAPERVVDVRI